MRIQTLRLRQGDSVGYLLIRAGQLWNELAIGRVNALAGGPVLRESHTRLLPLLIRPEGVRLTELSRRLGLTKQAVQPLVAELAALGVVTSRNDAKDRRASRIVLTPRGVAGIAKGNDVLKEIERELSAEFGRTEMKHLRKLLARLLSQLEAREIENGEALPPRAPDPRRRRRALHGRKREKSRTAEANDDLRSPGRRARDS